MWRGLTTLVLLLALALPAWPQTPAAPTLVYLVRHGETEGTPRQLSAAGQARAKALVENLRNIRFTHVFSSHTRRSRQTAEAVAAAQRTPLTVVQLPAPGSRLNGRTVDETTPSSAAAGPLLEAVRMLPQGSTAFVAGNRDNLFAIINGLGVPLCSDAPAGNPRDNCVPCRDGSCYDDVYDRMFIVRIAPGQPVRLAQLRYGAPGAAQ